ncbi:MAG: membrane dipeptidase [Rhodothermales bacterium]|jgi:membrane dipeptidase
MPRTAYFLPLLLTACMSTPSQSTSDRALALAQDAIIVDGHIDVPYRMTVWEEDVTQATYGGDFDYPRARVGGLDSPFMAIYIPPELQGDADKAAALADSLIDMVEGFISRAPDKFAPARSVADVRANHAAGLISLPMGMENGSPVADDPRLLTHYFDRGIRYITLTHGLDNGLSDSSYDSTGTWQGLSPLGKETVRRMNALGIMVDISHVTDRAARDVLEVTDTPVIASHSSVRAFTPGWERNMSDDLIRALAANGGVIMITFGSSFLREDYQTTGRKAQKAIQESLAESGLEGEAFHQAMSDQRNRTLIGTVDDVVAHINHVRDLVGVAHIGLGSDFDGVFALPAGLHDVSTYPALIQALLEEGYSEEEVRGILGENLLRVWAEVETRARQR